MHYSELSNQIEMRKDRKRQVQAAGEEHAEYREGTEVLGVLADDRHLR